MIEVTKINGIKVLINPDLMEFVEETPDTVISFTTGRKIIVKARHKKFSKIIQKGYFCGLVQKNWVSLNGYSVNYWFSSMSCDGFLRDSDIGWYQFGSELC